VARLWVDCFDYQSNTVILAELVLRGRPQPVHKAPREIGGLFCFKDVSKACFRKRTRSKKGNETRSGSLKTPEYSGQALGKDAIQGCRRNEMKPTIPKTKTPKSYEIGVFLCPCGTLL